MLFVNKCSGGGAEQKLTQTIYINKLIIYPSVNGDVEVKYTPTFFQKLKTLLGMYPPPKKIVQAVKSQMLE